ncbi:hypothetical protein HDV00_002254 [Rhizophlyctis rosea]|nr:hypothetical protein HDV00_002254 [Rhizophlyctis rosea]
MKKLFAKFSKPADPTGPPPPAKAPTPTTRSAPPANANGASPLASPAKPPAAGSGQFKSGFEENYFLGKQLGVGSFATVKECTRKEDSKKFAVKIIDKLQIRGKDDMIRSEISILKKIQHPNIIALKDLYETTTHLYLVTDLATGGELFDQIFAKGSYTEKDAGILVRQLLDALAYLHGLDIVHRDLKPENLLFKDTTETSDILITDFGLSKIAVENFLQTACGTPHYVAPEILQQTGHGKPVDMWAMGVITYVLLCGYTPFWGGEQNSNVILFRAIMECNYQFDEEYWAEVSPQAKDFIEKLLVLDPSKRLTAAEALEHPWLKSSADATVDLKPIVQKNFNARRTFRKAVLAVSGMQRVAKGTSGSLKNLLSAAAAEASTDTFQTAGTGGGEGVKVQVVIADEKIAEAVTPTTPQTATV